MKQPNASSQNEWMDARVEAYIDEALPEDEMRRFASVLHEESYWQAQVHHARRIQDTLHETRTPPVPPALTQQIFQQTSRSRHHESMSWWKRTLQQMVHSWRALGAARRHPVFDYAVGLAFVGMAAFFIATPLERGSNPASQQASQFNVSTSAPYSAEEIRHATESAQWSLSELSELGTEATRSLREQVYRVVGASTDAPGTAPASSEAAPNTAPDSVSSNAPSAP